MIIHLEKKDLTNIQQMEVAINGPDGATHLVLCTGVAKLSSVAHNTYTFHVGPQLSRRQFVGVIASGAIATIQTHHDDFIEANLILIEADYDDDSRKVKVKAHLSCGNSIAGLAISYNISILAELPSPESNLNKRVVLSAYRIQTN